MSTDENKKRGRSLFYEIWNLIQFDFFEQQRSADAHDSTHSLDGQSLSIE